MEHKVIHERDDLIDLRARKRAERILIIRYSFAGANVDLAALMIDINNIDASVASSIDDVLCAVARIKSENCRKHVVNECSLARQCLAGMFRDAALDQPEVKKRWFR